MSGHSKWASIKHKKARMDDRRGKIFSKLIKELTTAARIGGGDESANPRLRQTINSAKALNMPQANIDRAIKKGTGELPGVTYEEGTYEGYGPGGIAILIDVLTDNKNRSVADIRHVLNKHNGSMAEAGAVSWMFDKKGHIIIENYSGDEDSLMEIALDAGAEDIIEEDETYEIITSQETFDPVRNALAEGAIGISSAEITMIPKSLVKVEGTDAVAVLKLLEAIEDLEDVQNVYANFDINPSQVQVDT